MSDTVTIDKAEYERLKRIEKYASDDIDWEFVEHVEESLAAAKAGRVIETTDL